jgi:hypothetical protein
VTAASFPPPGRGPGPCPVEVAMRRLLLPLLSSSLFAAAGGCAVVPLTRDASLAVEDAASPRSHTTVAPADGSVARGTAGNVEVRCGFADLCAEVHVTHVDRQRRADGDGDDGGGSVDVTLLNRTADPVAVQVALETFDARRRRTDRTGFHDVVLAPRDDGVVTLVTTADGDDVLVIHVRPRRT